MLKKLLFSTTFLFVSVFALAQTVTINESGGWLETAYAKWTPVTEAESYNVYYSGEGITNQKIDTQLIRCYDGYFRADVLGLKAGTYTISIAPVISGIEGASSITNPITVEAHDRTGFAFSNGRVPGAYNLDGTPKSGAVILYITEESKDTIELTVTGANANPCIGLETILEGFKKGDDNRPLIVRLVGQITDFAYMSKGDIVLENDNNPLGSITLEGVGDDAVADGWGIRVKNASNIEIRNIGTMNCNSDEGDNIGLQQDNDYIWVHNVDFFYGDAGGDADQAKGDGALDSKRSGFVTISYNHFWDSGKSNLLGNGTEDPEYLNYHHNWYDHSDSRHPRIRSHSVHVYNNYYDGNSKYGVGSTNASSVFVEANYFRNCKYPILTSMQGTDIFYGSPTFSSEDGGTIKAFNNYISGETRFMPYNFTSPTDDFDAIVVDNRNDLVSGSITSKKGGNTYNNFDTNGSVMYSYTPDSPEAGRDKTIQYAGRMNGGDFNWTFNNATDDTSSSVITALKAALVSYTTGLLCVQGESDPPSSQTLTVTTGNNNQTVQEGNAIDSIVFTWGGDATDANISDLTGSGLSSIKDSPNKTITISGTPTGNVSYSVTTSGTAGTPVTESGTITVGIVASGDQIHNFTESGMTSTFYSITGNLSTSKGDAHYNGLTLTQCLKIESSTSISFSTAEESTLTLVFNDGFSGAIKVNGVSHNINGGILELIIPTDSYEITKDVTANLYYMSVESTSLKIEDIETKKLTLYPNPVTNTLHLSSKARIEKVEIYSLLGVFVKSIEHQTKTIDMGNLSNGSYLIKAYTNYGVMNKIIIKK